MEFDQNINTSENNNSLESGLDIKVIINRYLRFWKWFLLSFIISVLIAFIKLNFTRPQFEAKTSIKIIDEKRGDKSTLSAFQDLSGESSGYKDEINDEIVIIKSRSLVAEVVKSLQLNIRFFTKKNAISSFLDDNLGFNTAFFEIESYEEPPLKLNFFINDSILYNTEKSFIITINSLNNYTYSDTKNIVSKKKEFGKKLTTDFGSLIITPKVDLKKDSLINTSILVSISPIKKVVDFYVKNLSVQTNTEFSSIVNLSISDGRKQKAEDFLNILVQKYNDRAVSLKDELSKSTSDFVSRRLEIISNDLGDVDLTAQSIKVRYGISDNASKVGLNMQSSQQLERQVVDVNTQLQTIGLMKEFVSQNDGNELIPDLGVSDNNSTSFKQQYNQLMIEKQRLLKNSTEKNPTVVNISEQLSKLKQNFRQSLDNLESTQKITLDNLNKQHSLYNSRIYAAPKQEKLIRDIERQQQIKEQLYLYLLRKREETAISLGVAEPNAEIIDYALSLPFPISPKKKMVYLSAGLIGLIIPLLYLYLVNLLDTKIHTREEVERVLSVPIIGDIPKLEIKNKRYLISKEDYSSTAEAFRILRTNINFVVSDSNKKGKVFFITSTIAHEGKSLVSTNLATALALAGKKTLILGMDIRAPKIEPYLGIRGKIGVTNYIADSSVPVEDILFKAPNVDNLDIVSSGDLAPNPSELLMNPRVAELFAYARENYEYIIVDTAAFSMVTDTLLLSGYADAFIYVIRANFLDKRMLKYIKSLYHDRRLPKMSILINGVDHKKSYGYGYGYGYGVEYEKSTKKVWWKFGF
jgi:capsular exopolysaccharide synthesis family protein